MTDKDGGDAFASLHVGRSDEKLPTLQEYQYKAVAFRYPDEMAALTAFDIFIGNRDRNRNFIASLVTTNRIFGGIDHGMSLLSVEDEASKSLIRLENGELIVNNHPFYRLVDGARLIAWAERIASADPRDIEECCHCTTPIGSVLIGLQLELAEALLTRQSRLPDIISSHNRFLIFST